MHAMKKTALALAAAVLGVAVYTSALADRDDHHDDDRGRVHFGLYLGAPLGWDNWDAPPPYYSYPPPQVVAVPARPPVYVERHRAPRYWWYYCGAAGAYYPYVKHCPGGWQRVAPRPPRR